MNGVFGSKITGSLNSNAVLRNKLAEIAEIAKASKASSKVLDKSQQPRAFQFILHHV
jgi:hypothetical protein